jgi:hypothetical protein
MKKNLLTAIMLVGLSAFSKAQTTGRVGINTTTPAATLDVAANITDNTRPDALLVPRMTRAQLYAKDAVYIADQNGALAFVTSIDGIATAKTTNVTAVGFYYYDAPSSTWKTLGGGAVANPALNVTTEQTTSYVASATDDIILFNITSAGFNVTLPTSGIPIGKRVYISNRGGNSLDIIPAPRETSHTVIQPADAAILIYLGGTGAGSWSYLSGF